MYKILFFLTSFILSTNVFGQTALEKGEPSPGEGIFLTNEEAAKILAEREAAEKICKIKISTGIETEKINCQLDKELLKNEIKFQKDKFDQIIKLRDKQEEDLIKKIKEENNITYWFLGGAAAGVIVTSSAVITFYMLQK